MEIIVFFSLFLLVCSVSTNQTETGNEIVDQQTALQQSSLQDVHAVLRAMTASLTEQKTEIRILKQENQEQATKLERQRTELERQKTEQDRQKTELEKQRNETEQLKQQLRVKQVAFSASLLNTGGGDIGPSNTQTRLIFKRVVTNIGNAYNPHTGIFTAPVRGAYHFEWHIYGHGNIPAGAVLFRNLQHIYIAYEHQASHGLSSSNGASLLLEVGDQVFVHVWAGARLYDNQNHHNTFSGHLLFTM